MSKLDLSAIERVLRSADASRTIAAQDIAKITQLKACGLDASCFGGDLAALAQLRRLDISRNKFESLKGVDQFPQLDYLICTSNQLTSLAGLEACREMKILHASDNQLADVRAVSCFPKLAALILNKNKLSSLPRLVCVAFGCVSVYIMSERYRTVLAG